MPHQPSRPSDLLDPDTRDALRAVLDEAGREPAPAQTGQAAEAAAPRRSEPPSATAPGAPDPATPAGGVAAARLIDSARGVRPRPWQVALALGVGLMLFYPWVALALGVLAALTVTAIFLIFGYDGVWLRLIALARWQARRDPARGAALHARLDAFALRFDAFLDRFPEGTVDGLYLPDLGALEEARRRHEAAVDQRLSRLREGAG